MREFNNRQDDKNIHYIREVNRAFCKFSAASFIDIEDFVLKIEPMVVFEITNGAIEGRSVFDHEPSNMRLHLDQFVQGASDVSDFIEVVKSLKLRLFTPRDL